MDFRTIINRRLQEQGLTPYALAQRLKGKIAPATLYDFLRGTSAINSAYLAIILDALGLRVKDEQDEKPK